VKWAQEQGLIAPVTLPNGKTVEIKVKSVKVPRKVVDTLSPAEVNALEAAADTERDRLIIRVLANTGVRLSELLGLKTQDIVQEGAKWYLRVEGRSYGGGAKGDKGRMVPLTPPELGKRLRRFATQGRQPEAYSDHIFLLVRRSRRTGAFEPLAARGVQTMLEAVAERAGISRSRCHPHAFRHSFVTNSLRRGVNPVVVQQIAGHRDLSMIATVYAHVNASDGYDALMAALVKDEDNGK
jgi:integrase/recombinase XerD